MPHSAPNISGTTKRNRKKGYDNEGWNEDMEIPLFHFTDIANATKNFSSDNKLGEGGFGPVYMVNENILTLKVDFLGSIL